MRTIYSSFEKSLTALVFVVVATLLASMTSLLAGCGASGPAAANTTPTSAASIQLLVDTTQIPSAGGTTVNATAVVLTSAGQTVVGQAVTFSTNGDPSAYFSSASAVTDANGAAAAKLNVGANKTNRVITISATAGTATGSNTVAVTGTSVSISGNNALAAGASTPLTISVKDSAGNAMQGIPVSVSSQSGNGIAFTGASGGTTDSSGQVIATVTASTAAATDVITATAAGMVKTQNLTISNSTFAFTAPIAGSAVQIATATPVTVHWAIAGAPVVGTRVDFSASRGTLTPAFINTDGSGNATVNINSATTGSGTISATGPGGAPAASVVVDFYTNLASTVTAQASPGTIATTTGGTGQTGQNSSVISVVVRDAANNLVQNARVNFAIVTDVTGGALSSSTATTDSNGAASVNYIAGSTSSPQNGVTISATVVSITNGGVTTPVTGVTGTVNLTVSGLSLLVRLGTDNLVAEAPPLNRKTYVAFVTDAGMNAMPGVTVSFKLRPRASSLGYAYQKGYWELLLVGNPASLHWVQHVTATCNNEDDGAGGLYPDLAFNGFLDTNINGTGATEDVNGDGRLWPSGDATITPTAVTDSYGVAYATITYAKDHGEWVVYTVEARTGGLNSNDPPATAPFFFPGLGTDYTDINVSPPGNPSPYGIGVVCTDPL